MKAIFVAIVAVAVMCAALPACNVLRGQETAGQYVDDVTLTTKVKAELLDSSKVEGLDVNVDVNKGRVTLSGWADNQAERTKATQLAAAITGVKSVDNNIKIKQ
jgi:hyperosmotically inducible periplasmic protein